MNMRKVLISFIVCASLAQAGCGLFSVHQIDIQQGNALEPEDVERVQVGMTSQQVEFILGKPVLRDPFHPERWDYLYYLDPGEGETRSRRLVLFFDGDRVQRIERRPESG